MQELENIYQDAYFRAKCLKGLFTHDISNLFQVISNSIELCETLLKDNVNVDDIMEFFELITQQVNRGKKLIKNVRNLSEVEEYEMPLNPVDVLSTLEQAIEFTHISFPNKDINIDIINDSEIPYVMANELLLDVFENLLMNSIHHNKSQKIQISVVLTCFTSFLKLEFKDNGIGIEDERKETLLNGSNVRSTRSRGMGIGLSLVSKLIELYNGKMWIEDRVSGDHSMGSNFIIIIPLTTKERLIINDK